MWNRTKLDQAPAAPETVRKEESKDEDTKQDEENTTTPELEEKGVARRNPQIRAREIIRRERRPGHTGCKPARHRGTKGSHAGTVRKRPEGAAINPSSPRAEERTRARAEWSRGQEVREDKGERHRTSRGLSGHGARDPIETDRMKLTPQIGS